MTCNLARLADPILLLLLLAAPLSAQEWREDLNRDGRADPRDALYLLRERAAAPGDPRLDLDGDGRAAVSDALVLLLRAARGDLTPLGRNPVALGSLELYPTWSAVGAELGFSGPLPAGGAFRLLWRRAGETVWRNGPDLVVDSARALAWAGIFPLEQGERLEVRALHYDPASGATVETQGTTATRTMVLEPAGGRSFHVSPVGSDSAPGDALHPWRSIGHAAGLARAGDIVWVHAGTYAEGDLLLQPRGEPEAPVVFAAAPGERVLLDSSLEFPIGDSGWNSYGSGIYYRAPGGGYQLPGYGYVSQDGKRVHRYESLATLAANDPPAPRGWYWDSGGGRLYVRAAGGAAPGLSAWRLARHAWGFFLSGCANVVVRGFELQHYGSAAVRLSEGAEGCVVYGNTIRHCTWGVFLKHAATHGNAVWENEISEDGLLEIPWSTIKAGEYPRQGIAADATGRGGSYCRNTLSGWFDGIVVDSWQQVDQLALHRDTDVMFNLIHDIGDDALELDGGGVNLRAHGNRIRNALVAISLAPVERGPVYVTRNEATFLNMFFKFNVGSRWSEGWTLVYHNSGYGLNTGNGMAAVGLTGEPSGGPICRNKWFANNALIGADRAVRTGYDGNNRLDHDCWWHAPGLEPRKFEWNGATYFTLEEFRRATGQEAHGLYADPAFRSTPGLGAIPWKGFTEDLLTSYPLAGSAATGDFSLRPESPCRDRGQLLRGFNDDYRGMAPDIGAHEL